MRTQEKPIFESVVAANLEQNISETARTPSELATIAIAATFTAEPLAEYLTFWDRQLQLQTRVKFAGYNQVMQSLLDPGGLFGRNSGGMNVVLIRFEDWERFRSGAAGKNDSFGEQINELIGALGTAARMASSPILVCICPSSPEVTDDPEESIRFDQAEKDLVAALGESSMIRCIPSAELMRLYPVVDYSDSAADKLGHIPYKPEMFAALATIIARTFQSVRRAPFKVIVLDCDNTLWDGICGEGGADGVKIDVPRRTLQNAMKVQQKRGALLCLCSKNNWPDVEAVFNRHPEMLLGLEDITAWRVNWQVKSENIRSLAEELQLGLDSFILIDDNPAEIAEVRANCPGVLALMLPECSDLIPRFIDHVWAFDRFSVTAEDKQRTATYQDNQLRKKLQMESPSYADFLAGLAMEIEIRELKPGEEARAAQLTQRTNQFNMVTKRCTESEIQEMMRKRTARILTVFVRDRLGEYGQVGLVMYGVKDRRIQVQNLMLSCRVLGKGVEHAMLAHLGQIAQTESLGYVEVPYVPTAKNVPARDFLASFPSLYREDLDQGFVRRFPANFAATVRFSPEQGGAPKTRSEQQQEDKPGRIIEPGPDCASFEWIATNLCDAKLIREAAQASSSAATPRVAFLDPPRTELEKQITEIWESALGISPIGIHDNYFDLGGDSLRAVNIFVEIEKVTRQNLPLVTLFEAPTIAELARLLRDRSWKPHWRSLVPIKTSGGRPPFYCVHGVGGNIIEFMDLARHIHHDQPLYGIQAIGLDGKSCRENLTVEQMAAHYIREICEFQPCGPYYIGGSSFGGLVAYEMARQFQAKGQEVAIVALFDTYGPAYPKLVASTTVWQQRFNKLRYRARVHWSNFLATEPRKRPEYAWIKAKRIKRAIVSKAKAMFRSANQSAKQHAGRFFLPNAIRQVADAGHWAAADYVPGEYSGSITLFRATQQPLGIYTDRTLGWASIVKGGIEICDTPGHHGSLVREPRVPILAEQLDDALRNARLRNIQRVATGAAI